MRLVWCSSNPDNVARLGLTCVLLCARKEVDGVQISWIFTAGYWSKCVFGWFGWAVCPDGDLDGNCRVDFNDVKFLADRWMDGPGSEVVQINDSVLTSTAGTYVEQTGSLRVTISPPAAVTAGAKWRVDGGAWQSSGATVGGLHNGPVPIFDATYRSLPDVS